MFTMFTLGGDNNLGFNTDRAHQYSTTAAILP